MWSVRTGADCGHFYDLCCSRILELVCCSSKSSAAKKGLSYIDEWHHSGVSGMKPSYICTPLVS